MPITVGRDPCIPVCASLFQTPDRGQSTTCWLESSLCVSTPRKEQALDPTNGETWRFTIRTSPAQQVFLAVDGLCMPSRWLEMQRVAEAPGAWQLETTLLPGRHRLRYFTVNNGTTLNCGSDGITGERITEPHPEVLIDDLVPLAASA